MTTFMGLPINGSIIRGEHRAVQHPLEELTPAIQAVLDDPGITKFGWKQYTPYFNDGEPCVFSAGQVWALPAELSEDDEGDYELMFEDGAKGLGEIVGATYGYNDEGNWGATGGTYEGPDEARYRRVEALNQAIAAGAFDDVLLEAFGDHADVTVSQDGIHVEQYCHD